MSWAFDDEDVQTWLPGQPFPERVRDHTGQIRAHNAAFERLIFWYVLQIDYDLEQFYCTATQARANCAPGSLEDVGRFAGASMRKDHRGGQLVRALCIPRPDGAFNDDPALMAELVAYCEQDVRAMRAISQTQRQMSADEQADYHVNERINDAGVLVDVPLAKAAQVYAAAELEEIQALVASVTEGVVTSVRSPRMREWVWERVGPQAQDLMTVTKGDETKRSIDKNVRASLLVLAEENPDEVPAAVADVVQCADDLWASSVAKFARMAALADDEDHRVRGAFVFAGGAATGRASSYGLQVHNFARKTAKEPEAVRHAMVRGHQIVPTYGKRVTDVLKGMLRPALVAAPGKMLVTADWSAIEARVNPWLSNCPAGEAKLDLFRTGEDIYKVNAAATFGVAVGDVDDPQRQIGKVQELACIAEDTMVWTSNGLKAIVDVRLSDKLWDGDQWVSHQGVVSRGVKPTISVCGMSVTEDHLLLVKSGWLDAKTVLSCSKYQTQALEIGLATSPSWGRHLRSTRAAWCLSSAHVGRSPTPSISTTCARVPLPGATIAPRKPPGTGGKTTSNTPRLALTTTIGGGFSTACQLAGTAATTQKTPHTLTMVRAASASTSRGDPTKPLSCDMSSRLRGGMSLVSNWIASTWTRVTSQVICGSSRAKPTWQTDDPSKTCKPDAMPLRRVYDIAHVGPRNRFMVATPEGQVIVHNCGFGGSVGAFSAMGRVYSVVLPEAQSRRMVEAWRRANPWAVDQWSALERAYTTAMRQPGYEITAGRITYLYDRQHLWYALPSGRVLCYPFARFDRDGISYAKAAWKPAQDATEWPRARLWHGLACENIVQAVANDLLRDALRRLDAAGQRVILHVHDEIVIEGDETAAEVLAQVMTTAPAWAAGLPLAAEVNIRERYGK